MAQKFFFLVFVVFYAKSLFAQELKPKITANKFVLLLNDKTGYQGNFAVYSEKNNTYIRTASTRRHGSFMEFYNLQTGALDKVWHFPEISGLTQFVENEDGKYWAFDVNIRWLYLIDHGKITEKIHELNTERTIELKTEGYIGSYTNYYSVQSFNVMAYHHSNLYIVPELMSINSSKSDFANMGKSGFIRCYDTEKKQLGWVGRFPRASLKDDYGFMNRFSANRIGDQLLIAPFYSNEFFVYDLNSGQISYPNVPQNNTYYQITPPFAPLSHTPKSLKDGARRHFRSNAYYLVMIHDPYRKLFYRIKVNPETDQGPVDREIVVLNSDYSLKGAYQLPSDTYKTDGMFVTKDGLNILNYEQYKKDNTKLVFDGFVF